MKSVGKPISFSSMSKNVITKLYKFLSEFHKATGHVHRDIYHKNILVSGDDDVFLNDFDE
jgi:thiamine kinase-like enzyme